jgi:hypothetical protein
MNTKMTTALGIVAGFVGGAMSHYLFEAIPVHAQALAQPAAEIRAQKFVLVDKGGVSRGAFGIETDGTAQIEVIDQKGKLWLYRSSPAKFSWKSPTASDHPKVFSLVP